MSAEKSAPSCKAKLKYAKEDSIYFAYHFIANKDLMHETRFATLSHESRPRNCPTRIVIDIDCLLEIPHVTGTTPFPSLKKKPRRPSQSGQN